MTGSLDRRAFPRPASAGSYGGRFARTPHDLAQAHRVRIIEPRG